MPIDQPNLLLKELPKKEIRNPYDLPNELSI